MALDWQTMSVLQQHLYVKMTRVCPECGSVVQAKLMNEIDTQNPVFADNAIGLKCVACPFTSYRQGESVEESLHVPTEAEIESAT